MELERALELELKKNELNKKGIGIGIELKGVGIIIWIIDPIPGVWRGFLRVQPSSH